MNKKKIVVLGGGYAGVHAAKTLNKAFKKHQDESQVSSSLTRSITNLLH